MSKIHPWIRFEIDAIEVPGQDDYPEPLQNID
jgi:hypothetical protein